MSVTAPPRPSDPVDRQEVEDLVEALIEEARQRARRRRCVRMAVVACLVLVGASVFAVFERTAKSQNSYPAHTAKPGAVGSEVKVVIAGTNDKSEVHDGTLAGTGTFKASGAVTDTGKALAYRRVGLQGTLITLRYVTKGKKGTITYVVRIDTNAGTSRWTIASASGRAIRPVPTPNSSAAPSPARHVRSSRPRTSMPRLSFWLGRVERVVVIPRGNEFVEVAVFAHASNLHSSTRVGNARISKTVGWASVPEGTLGVSPERTHGRTRPQP